MLINTRYVVIYKDSPTSQNKYYGPFVSDTIALDFCDSLPVPQKGGNKTYRVFTHFGHDQAKAASADILRQRAA